MVGGALAAAEHNKATLRISARRKRYCQQCGNRVSRSAKKCDYCGRRLLSKIRISFIAFTVITMLAVVVYVLSSFGVSS